MLSNLQSSPTIQGLDFRVLGNCVKCVEFSLNFDTDHFQDEGKTSYLKKRTDISYLMNLRAVS